MSGPLAKGIIIGVSVIIAAGIAAYESPQVRSWVKERRRKLSEALHKLGDEISPEEKRRVMELHDISMTEDQSDEAEWRRRQAREEIMQRAAFLENRKHNMTTGGSPVRRTMTSFDSLVDGEGRLIPRSEESETAVASSSGAQATGVDIHDFKQPVRRPNAGDTNSAYLPTSNPFSDSFAYSEYAEHANSDKAYDDKSSVSGPLTPTSDSRPGSMPETPRLGATTHPIGLADPPSDYFTALSSETLAEHDQASVPASSQTLGRDATAPGTPRIQPQEHASTGMSPARSGSASTFSHITDDALTEVSADMMSDVNSNASGRGVLTPEWSEIGSVISTDDAHHH